MRKTSYAGAALIVAGLLVLIFVVAVFRLDQGNYQTRTARSERLHQVIDAAEDALSALKDAETGQRGYLVTGDTSYLEPYHQGIVACRLSLSRLKALTAGERAVAVEVQTLTTTAEERIAELGFILGVYSEGDQYGAISAVQSGEGKRLMDQARATTDGLLRLEKHEFADTQASIDRLVSSSRYRFFGATAVLFVLMVTGALLLSFEIRRERALAVIVERSEARYRELAATLEQQVHQRTLSLQNANHALHAFSYSVSHDLRAPLRSIDGFSLIVLEDYADLLDDTGRDMLNRIRAAAIRMGRLIQSLLDLGRFTDAELHREPVSLSQAAENIMEGLTSTTPARNAEIVIAPNLNVNADPLLLGVVLQNLLANAWKFTSRAEVARIEVGTLNQAGVETFFVRDNGSGFDSRFADRLFTPFQRLHSEAEFEGSGIGLATVQRVIHRHEGKIWAESSPGEGATFYFTF